MRNLQQKAIGLMIVKHAFSAASKCSNCRYNAVQAFVSLASIPLRPLALKPSGAELRIAHLTPTRNFTISKPWWSETAQREGIDSANAAIKEAVDEDHTALEENGPESDSSLPWYLQVETPQRTPKSLVERQRLPDLPPDPPPLLNPILEKMSADLGLDDLYLIDLRKLNPPSALGPQLIMLLGTARSEKHLHVSADRFCRWLRSTYKLRPHPDGLLGRGQLKIKLKRKARRAKLLSAVRSSEKSNQDDGLSTGWICVNVGTIDDGETATTLPVIREGFVGFDEQEEGSILVVQMLTQEKREELDLEQLWGNMLETQKRKQARSSRLLADVIPDQEVGNSPLLEQKPQSDSSPIISSSPQKYLPVNKRQRREFHSSAQVFRPDFTSKEYVDNPGLVSASTTSGKDIALEFNLKERRKEKKKRYISKRLQLNPVAETSEMGPELGKLLEKFECMSDKLIELMSESRCIVWEAHLMYLGSLPREHAIEVLGNGIKDFTSTSFLASFYESFPLFHQSEHWHYRISLVCHAVDVGHPKYKLRHLLSLFDDIRISLIHIPLRTFLRIFKTVLSSRVKSADEIHESLKVLEDMALRGLNVYTKKTLLTLYSVVARVGASDREQFLRLRSNANTRLRLVMDDCFVEPMETKTQLPILNDFVLGDNWEGFWSHWRGIAARMQPRSGKLYLLMFRYATWTRNQKKCMYVLRTWFHEMMQEEPEVRLDGELTQAVMECLRIAQPESETKSMHERYQSTEWTAIWNQCYDSLERSKKSA